MNILKLSVNNADELLTTGAFGAGAVIRVESSALSTSGFTEIGTVTLVALTYAYTYYDQTAATGLYYRVRYSNLGNTNRSDYSDVFQANDSLPQYCSLYDVKQRLGIAATDLTNDEDFLQFIGQTSGWIDSRTGRHFLPDPPSGSRTYTFDGYETLEYGRCLLIARGVQSVSLLEVATNTGGTFSTVPATDYFLQPSPQNRERGWPATEIWMTDIPSGGNNTPLFFPGYQNIRVTGVFSWAALPTEIEDIALTAVVNAWRRRSSAGGTTITIGTAGERTIQTDLTQEQWKTLERYTLRVPVIV